MTNSKKQSYLSFRRFLKLAQRILGLVLAGLEILKRLRDL